MGSNGRDRVARARKKFAATTIAALFAWGLPARAADDVARTYRWMGSETFSCGNWPRSAAYTRADKALMLNWVLGFLSRAGGEEGRPDILRGVDQETVSVWLDNYCTANPLDGVATAAHRLQDELTRRARGR